MIDFEYLPISETDLDVKKTFEFGGIQYKLRLRKNTQGNFYTVEVFDIEDNFLFANVVNYLRPFLDAKTPAIKVDFTAFNINDLITPISPPPTIDANTLGDSIKLYTAAAQA